MEDVGGVERRAVVEAGVVAEVEAEAPPVVERLPAEGEVGDERARGVEGEQAGVDELVEAARRLIGAEAGVVLERGAFERDHERAVGRRQRRRRAGTAGEREREEERGPRGGRRAAGGDGGGHGGGDCRRGEAGRGRLRRRCRPFARSPPGSCSPYLLAGKPGLSPLGEPGAGAEAVRLEIDAAARAARPAPRQAAGLAGQLERSRVERAPGAAAGGGGGGAGARRRAATARGGGEGRGRRSRRCSAGAAVADVRPLPPRPSGLPAPLPRGPAERPTAPGAAAAPFLRAARRAAPRPVHRGPGAARLRARPAGRAGAARGGLGDAGGRAAAGSRRGARAPALPARRRRARAAAAERSAPTTRRAGTEARELPRLPLQALRSARERAVDPATSAGCWSGRWPGR